VCRSDRCAICGWKTNINSARFDVLAWISCNWIGWEIVIVGRKQNNVIGTNSRFLQKLNNLNILSLVRQLSYALAAHQNDRRFKRQSRKVWNLQKRLWIVYVLNERWDFKTTFLYFNSFHQRKYVNCIWIP